MYNDNKILTYITFQQRLIMKHIISYISQIMVCRKQTAKLVLAFIQFVKTNKWFTKSISNGNRFFLSNKCTLIAKKPLTKLYEMNSSTMPSGYGAERVNYGVQYCSLLN